MNVDLESVDELIRTQDVEGFIAEGAPEDEYEGEIEAVYERLRALPVEEASRERLMAVLEEVWARSFSLSAAELKEREGAFGEIVGKIRHFFVERQG
jgi:hypothetical protein